MRFVDALVTGLLTVLFTPSGRIFTIYFLFVNHVNDKYRKRKKYIKIKGSFNTV